MFLSRRTILAISIMIDIAQNAREHPVSAKELAERHGVLPRFFEIMLKNLAGAGLIKGQRGPKGGYGLAREPRRITAAEIVSAVSVRSDEKEWPMPAATRKALQPFLQRIETATLAKLAETSLDDFVKATNDNKPLLANFAV